MLVVLYFYLLGYSPFEVAMLFLFYEFFGVVTNLVGGWLGARIGLNLTMHIGMALQILALSMLTVPDAWLSVVYVMAAQALSGIAKDLNKMSAKASVKTLVSGDESRLFTWVAALTGSKNTLKGAGFFIGAALLEWIGFRGALLALAAMLLAVLAITYLLLPGRLGGRLRHGPGPGAPALARCRPGAGRRRIQVVDPGPRLDTRGHCLEPGSGLSAGSGPDRRPGPVRRRVHRQFGPVLVPDPCLLRRQPGVDESRFLLHGERRWSSAPITSGLREGTARVRSK